MKKIILAIMAVISAVATYSQPEIIHVGQREPTYYYWDTNWYDYYMQRYPGCDWSNGVMKAFEHGYCKPEIARYFYTDSSLRVIGIAGALFFVETDIYHEGDVYKDYKPEYFCLYETDSTGGMTLLGKKEFILGMQPRYLLTDSYVPPVDGFLPNGIKIYELFFDSALTVRDSFYVSATGNNDYRRPSYNKYVTTDIEAMFTSYKYATTTTNPNCNHLPNPNHFKRKLHKVDYYDFDERFGVTDTNWHIFNRTYIKQKNGYVDSGLMNRAFYFLFPIIDTSRDLSWLPDCERPEALGTLYVNKEVAVLQWSGGSNAGSWEMTVTADGTEEDTVNLLQFQNDVAAIYGLDTATWYTARVRSVCYGKKRSEWSDSLRFFVPGDTTSHNDDSLTVATVADRYTYLLPNPAKSHVSVASSFRILNVEIYSLTGQSMLHREVDALSTTLDISTLPSGTYIVRIHTTQGVSTKKLVVTK